MASRKELKEIASTSLTDITSKYKKQRDAALRKVIFGSLLTIASLLIFLFTETKQVKHVPKQWLVQEHDEIVLSGAGWIAWILLVLGALILLDSLLKFRKVDLKWFEFSHTGEREYADKAKNANSELITYFAKPDRPSDNQTRAAIAREITRLPNVCFRPKISIEKDGLPSFLSEDNATITYFEFSNGNLLVKFRNGVVLDAPLLDCEFNFSLPSSKRRCALTRVNGIEVIICELDDHPEALPIGAWDTIFNILSHAGTTYDVNTISKESIAKRAENEEVMGAIKTGAKVARILTKL